LSAVFVATMDELIYMNFRKNVIMPFEMARMSGSNTSIATDTLVGTGRFIKEMVPHSGGLFTDNAKALLLKDTDYSTPTDHYFAYLQKLKSEEAHMS